MVAQDIRENVGRKTSSAVLRSGLALAGVLVIVLILWRTGWPNIRANLRLIGVWFLGLVVLNMVTQAAFVIGLRNLLDPRPRWRDFTRLYAIYLMGDAANYVAPGGGEAAKAHLLRKLGGGEAATAAVTLHKHADLLAQCTFAVVGVAVALIWFDLPRTVAAAAILGALSLVVILVLLTWALGRGAFSPILRRFARWRFLAPHVQRLQSRAEAVDARIVQFHSAHRGRFLLIAATCVLGWCGGLFETWIVLKLLAPSAGWPAAIAVESLAMVLGNAVLFVPGKLGGADGIRTGLFVLIGLSASQGAAYSLVRRTRELVWVLPGWALFLRERLRRDGALRSARPWESPGPALDAGLRPAPEALALEHATEIERPESVIRPALFRRDAADARRIKER